MSVLLIILVIVVLVVLGVAAVGLALKLLWWAIVGLVIGALARLVLPGRQAIGWLWTIGAGVAGALLGGVLAGALGLGGFLEFVLAVAVAAALIGFLASRRRGALVTR